MNLILTTQGVFYVLTGIWPVIHMASFERVSGLKVDKWLVKLVGLLLMVSGIIFIKFTDSEAALWLAIMDATVLIGIDVYYVWRKVIPKVYLLDALIESGFLWANVLN